MLLPRYPRLIVVLCLLVLSLPAAASVQVVVTLPPLHSLVAAVMAGVGEPMLLLPGGQSPHNYSMRPSDMRALARADLLVWVGEDMERFLRAPLQSTDVEQLAMIDLADLQRYPMRSGGVWESPQQPATEDAAHQHDKHEHEHAHEHAHEHGSVDPHLWLSPTNARVIVAALAARLAQLDPQQASTYQNNAQQLDARLATLDSQLAERLTPIREIPYLVFHDAYQYFETHYGLNVAGAITLDPDQQPGAARMRQIHQRLAEQDVACVFAEPQFRPALVDSLSRDSGIRVGVLDPLGAELQSGPTLYLELLENLAGSLIACLQATG